MCYRLIKKMYQRISQTFIFPALAALLIIAAASGSLAAEAGKASGTLTIDGSRITLRYSYVMEQPNTFEKNKTDMAVLLTEKPLAPDALADIEDLRDATRRMHGWAFFKINDKGSPIHEVIDHPALGGSVLMMSGFTNAEYIPKKSGKEIVEGSFVTRKPTGFGGHKYEIKADFSAPILQAKRPEPRPDAKTGKALPKDGGEPGKVYREYRKAIRNKDIAAIRRAAPASKADDMTEEELRQALEFMAALAPDNPRIIRGYVKGSSAVLYLEGIQDGEKQYGTVEFIEKNNVWRILKEEWSNTPPGK